MKKIKNNIYFNIGNDVVNINDFKNKSINFVRRVLTQNEFKQYKQIDNNLKPQFLAVRWGLKEAAYKAISEWHKIFFINIEFVKKNNKYVCTSFNNLKTSISYHKNIVYVVAFYYEIN